MNMSKVVRGAANLLFAFVLIFGFYIVLHGHLTPGGGFQGGAVIATAFVLLMVAYSFEKIRSTFRVTPLHVTESSGLLLFLATAAVALTVGATFFANWLANSGALFGMSVPFGPNPGELNTAGVIPIMNIAVGIEVLGALSVIVLYMITSVREGV